MTRDETDLNVLQPVMGNLERMLIDEFLRLRGLDRHAVDALPDTERHDLLAEASTHASARLTEIESRSHYIHELHGVQDASGSLGQVVTGPATPLDTSGLPAPVPVPVHAHVDAGSGPKRGDRSRDEGEAAEKPQHPWMTS